MSSPSEVTGCVCVRTRACILSPVCSRQKECPLQQFFPISSAFHATDATAWRTGLSFGFPRVTFSTPGPGHLYPHQFLELVGESILWFPFPRTGDPLEAPAGTQGRVLLPCPSKAFHLTLLVPEPSSQPSRSEALPNPRVCSLPPPRLEFSLSFGT